MPLVPLESLPDDARVWIFAATADIDHEDAPKLLRAVDRFLTTWAAHGHPLTTAREWRDDRFLAIAVDPRVEGASGCSIDGLFRTFKELERAIGTTLLSSGLVFFRDRHGLIHALGRDDFQRLARDAEVDRATPVFDTALTTLGDYRVRFERPAGESWHASLLTG